MLEKMHQYVIEFLLINMIFKMPENFL